MAKKKFVSLAEELNSLPSQVGPSSMPDVLKGNTAVQTTSKSQLIKANQGLAGDWEKTINSPTKEELDLNKIAREQQELAEAAKTRREGLSVPEGDIETAHKKVVGDEAFISFKERQEKIQALNKKLSSSLAPNRAVAEGLTTLNIISSIHDFFSGEDNKMSKANTVENKKLVAEKQILEDKQERELRPTIHLVSKEATLSKARMGKLWSDKVQNNLANPNHNNPISLEDLTSLGNKIKKFSDIWDAMKSSVSPDDKDKEDRLEQVKILSAYSKYDDAEKATRDYLDRNTSAWAGLMNTKKGLATVGVYPILEDILVAKVATTPEDQRSEIDNELLKAYHIKSDIQSKGLMKSEGWYNAGEGVGTSLQMVEGMFLTRGVSSSAEAVAAKTAQAALEKVVAKTALKSTLRKLGVNIIKKSVTPVGQMAGVASSTLLQPMTYQGMLNRFIGETRIVKDQNGEEKILVREGLYNQFKKDYDHNKKVLKNAYDTLVSKPNKSEEDEAELSKISDAIDNLDSEMNSVRPKSWLESFGYGYVEALKENASERWVGELASGKNIARLGNNKVGRYLKNRMAGTPISKGIKAISEVSNKGTEVFNNSVLGKLSSKIMLHTGANKIYHGLPGEILEEIATQATPTLGDTWVDYKNQLEELKNPQFYANIIGQSLLMSGGVTALGLGHQVTNWRKTAEMYDLRKSVRSQYKQMDRAVNDKDLAEVIVMNTGGTLFSIEDYNRKIEDLRLKGKTDPEAIVKANQLEQKKFFNLAVQAIQTNTLDEFEKSLNGIIDFHKEEKDNSGFSTDTIANVQMAKEKIAEIKKTYEKYSDKSNVGTIVELAAQKVTNKQTISELEAEMLKDKESATEEINTLLRDKNMSVDFNLDSLFDRQFEDVEEQEKYNKFLGLLEANQNSMPSLSTYASLAYTKFNMEQAHTETMKAFNEQVSPQFAIDAQKVKAINRQIEKTIGYIEEQGISDSIAKLDQNGKVELTAPLVESLFSRVDTQGLDKNKVKALKEKYLEAVKNREQQRKSQSPSRILSLYETTETEPKAENINPEKTDITETPIPEEVLEVSPDEVERYAKNSNLIRQTLKTAQHEYTEEEVDSIQQAFENNNQIISKEEINKIIPSFADAQAEVVANELNYILSKPTTSVIDVDTADIEIAIEEANNAMEDIAEVDLSEDSLIADSDSLLDENTEYQFQPLSASKFSNEDINQVKKVVKNVVDIITATREQVPSFKEMVAHIIKLSGKEKAEKFFDGYKVGWEANNFEATDYQKVYDDLFEPTKEAVDNLNSLLENIFGTSPVETTTKAEVIQDAVDQKEEIQKEESTTTIFTEENIPVKVVDSTRVQGNFLTFGFNSLEYREVQKENGNWVRETVPNAELKLEDSPIDFRDLLNPDMYNVGDTLSVVVAPESMWSTIKVNVGRDENNVPIIKTFAEIVAEKEKTNSEIEAKKAELEKELFSETDNKGRTFTYFSTTTKKEGLIKIKFSFNRSDKDSSQRANAVMGIPIEKALGDKYTIDETYIPEGAKVVGVSEIRITKGGVGATVTFEVDGERYQGEVKLNSNTTYDAELAALNQPKVSESGVEVSSNNFEGLDFGDKQQASQPIKSDYTVLKTFLPTGGNLEYTIRIQNNKTGEKGSYSIDNDGRWVVSKFNSTTNDYEIVGNPLSQKQIINSAKVALGENFIDKINSIKSETDKITEVKGGEKFEKFLKLLTKYDAELKALEGSSSQESDYRNSQEFIDSVPMFFTDTTGKPLAYVHDTAWYNVWNVADPTQSFQGINPTSISKVHADLIAQGKEEASKFRASIFAGRTTQVTITSKKGGAFYSIENQKNEEGNLIPLLTIEQANPQSEIVIQEDSFGLLVQGKGAKGRFENDKRKIINVEGEKGVAKTGGKGHAWHLRRIGVDPVDGKETWRAFKVNREVSEQEIETLKWAWSAYSMFDNSEFEQKQPDGSTVKVKTIQEIRNKFVPKEYVLTEEQAKKVISDIEKITGLNLMTFEDALTYFKLFLQPRSGNSIAQYGRTLYTGTSKDFAQHTSRIGIQDNTKVAIIKDGVVQDTGKNYRDYLKSVLLTGVKSFNVGTEEKPVYATSIQPVIEFSYEEAEVTKDSPQDLMDKAHKAANEVIKEITEENIVSPSTVMEEAKQLMQKLGFNTTSNNLFAQPVQMRGVENLRSIFNVTPGLNITQEQHLINFIYSYVNNMIDIKYKSKANKNSLFESLKDSYNEIVEPSRMQVQQVLSKLESVYSTSPSEQLKDMISNYKNMLNIFDNIESNWSSETIKQQLEKEGLPYEGQEGILEKAMQEVYKTSDIKEKKNTDEEDDKEKDLSQRIHSFEDNAALTESGKNKTTYRLRRFMSGIPRVDVDGNVITGFLGLPDYLNYNEVYDTIYQLLGSGVYIESNYETMKAKVLEMKNAQPWVVSLMEKFDKADIQLRKEFGANYRKHAVSMKFAMLTENSNGNSLQVYDTNANELTRVIIGEWKNNFKSSSLVTIKDGIYQINKERAKELEAQHASWGTEGHLQDRETVRKWLAEFGIKLSDGYWKELQDVGFYYQGENIPFFKLFDGNKVPIGLLSTFLTKIKDEADTNFVDNEKAHPYKDMGGVLKALAKGEAKYTAKILSKSFRDAQKNISGITNPTYATNRIDDLKRSALQDSHEFLEALKSLSINSNSTILELLLNDPNFASKMELNHLGLTAFKKYGKKANNFSSITDLNSLDHDITKLTMFQDLQQGNVEVKVSGIPMRIARMFVPTMSDKTQMYALTTGVFNFFKNSNLVFDRNEEGEVIFTPKLRELLFQKLVYPEMKRISNFHNAVKATNIKDYDKAAQIFNFIPALNNVKDENGDRIIQHLALLPLSEVEAKYKEVLTDAVEAVIHSLTAKKMQSWGKMVETDAEGKVINIKFFDSKYLASGQGSLEDKFELGTYDFVLNSVLSNADTFGVIAGDPALFSQDKLFGSQELPYNATDDNFYIKLSKKQGTNIGKRLAFLAAPGVTLADSNVKEKQNYKQLFLKDTKDISTNSKYLISLYSGEESLQETLLDNVPSTVEQLLDNYEESSPALQKSIKDALSNKYPKIADYFDIESTDAQEYTTAREHVEVLLGLGRISEETYKTVLNKIENKEDLTKEELDIVFQPIKPVYTGQIIDSKQDVGRVVYIKSSSFPLLPQLTAGTKLEALRQLMEEKGIARASYQTANKVGAMRTAVDPLSLESLKEADNATLILNRNDFRIQQDVPFKSDMKKEDKIAMGTQIFKLLFGDGMLQQTGFILNGNSYTGQQLYDIYEKSFGELVKIKKQSLYKELGLNEQGEAVDQQEAVRKLQNLLQKEAIGRDYPLQDIKGLEVSTLYDTQGNPYHEFKVPLWLSSNSNRFESLLNAIVTKRVMEHKIPGNSFVVGSENGFAYEDTLSDVSKSRIIYFDNYDGKALKAVNVDKEGNLQKAQVFIPSKFKSSNGKLVDLFEIKDNQYKYLEKRKNGSFRLKEGMIDPEILSNFSFRTPTSAHVSGSILEIAGILPPEMGDLMIVPKNFTKQKGLDFDVDKENVYQLNHVVDFKTGKITELTEEHKKEALKRLNKQLKQEDVFQSQIGLPSMDVFYEIIRLDFGDDFVSELQDTGNSILEQIERVTAEYDQKLLENTFIKIHNSVYTNPSKQVQARINKVLSMDFARQQADLIEDLNTEANNNLVSKELRGSVDEEGNYVAPNQTDNSFTILSDDYQKEKMGLGSAGKMAIGVYSNYVTLHSLIQQSPRQIRLMEEGEENPIPKEVVIGNLTSDGILGKRNTLDGERPIAEAFAERQNTGTDNEKEQILGRVNINNITIGVDSLLTLLGFDKTTYSTSEGKKNISISYALLSQPIIKEFVSRLQNGRGITSDFIPDLEEKAIQELKDKYKVPEGVDVSSSLLTGDALVNGIRNNGEEAKVQLAALDLFTDLREYAKAMAKTQSLVDTNNLGKSIVESNMTYEDLKNLPYTTKFSNVSSLIGDFIPIKDTTIKPEGYETIGDFFVKPTTPQGHIVVNGLTIGQKLWSDYFPYNEPNFELVVNTILKNSNVDLTNSYKVVEEKQSIIQEIKKYINSYKGLGLFSDVASQERKRLFMDTEGNMSLANYLNTYSREENITNNKLLNRFTYDVNLDGKPSLIKYNNTISDNLQEKYLYTSLAELMIEDKPLPDWNGKPFSTRKLGQELITYAYTEGGIQEAIQFIKYVPLEYLSEVGTVQNGQFIPAASTLQRINVARNRNVFKDLLGVIPGKPESSTFVKQYFQHNPDSATVLTNEVIKKNVTFSEEGLLYTSDVHPKFITIKNKSNRKSLKQEKFSLYEHLGGGNYQKISVLGSHGMNEYELGNRNAISILGVPKVKKTVVETPIDRTVKQDNDFLEIISGQTSAQVLESISTTDHYRYARYKAIAKILKEITDSNTIVKVVDTKKEIGVGVQGAYDSEKNTIFIDETVSNNKIGIFIHEIVHAITVKEIKQYYSQDAEGFYTVINSDAPSYVVSLHRVWQELIKNVDPTLVESTKEKIKLLKAGLPVELTPQEATIGYATTDIFEFMSVAIESKDLQKFMSEIKYLKSGKTILEKLADIIETIIQTLNPDLKEDSLAREALSSIFNFIQAETEKSKAQKTFEEIPFDGEAMEQEQQMSEDLFNDIDKEMGESEEQLMPLEQKKTTFEENKEDTQLPCEGGLGI